MLSVNENINRGVGPGTDPDLLPRLRRFLTLEQARNWNSSAGAVVCRVEDWPWDDYCLGVACYVVPGRPASGLECVSHQLQRDGFLDGWWLFSVMINVGRYGVLPA